MAPDRLRARRVAPLVALLLALVPVGAGAQTTRARGDYEKAIPIAPRTAAPAEAAPQTAQSAPAPPAPAQPREPVPRRPPAAMAQGQVAPRQEAEPGAPPVIIWQPSEATPARPAAARSSSRMASTAPPGASPAPPPPSPAERDAAAARAAADSFYRTYLQLRPIAGLPNATQRLRLRPHLSPALEAALTAAAKAEADSQRSGGGPMQDGDVFTSHGEGAGTISIGDCQPEAPRIACAARMSSGPGMEWQDKIFLSRGPAGWKVDDAAYGGRFANGNFGSLRELLTILVRHVSPRPAPPNAGQPPQPAAQ